MNGCPRQKQKSSNSSSMEQKKRKRKYPHGSDEWEGGEKSD